ncbi:hypothetical protein GCM10009535_59050 [Streptomyces thermocarboxydovorans]|uniref:Uncharacterized protein n=1 Tax=Streptomyces thermocarboxydovorans TaxID=59298 RepID=A0ABN1HWZ4_9ACTN
MTFKEWLDQAIASGDAVVNGDGSVTVTLPPHVVEAIRELGLLARQIQEES